MFSSPFPNIISFVCGDLSLTKNHQLHFEEEKIAETFKSQKRKDDFILGRRIARLALKEFKLESHPILRNPKTREPCWPKSVCGSITHSGKLAAAAVGLSEDILGIGLDLEDLSRKIDLKLSKHICVKNELNWLDKQSPEKVNRSLRIIFSAKESIFKCLFPLTGIFFNFKDACIELNKDNSEFCFSLSNKLSSIKFNEMSYQGFFSFKDEFLLTSIYIKNR